MNVARSPLSLHETRSTSGTVADNVLLLHGFGSDRHSWAGNVATLQLLARTFTLDLPGHGSATADVGDGSVGFLADCILTTLTTADVSRVHLVGHSLGGAIALEIAARSPDTIASLALLSPAGLGVSVSSDFLSRFPAVTSEVEAVALLQQLVVNPRLISRQMAPMVLNTLDRPGVRSALLCVAKGMTAIAETLSPAISAVIERDIPRMVVWGREDEINPLNEQTLEVFGGVQHLLDNCGHLPQVEKRKEVNTLLEQFIELHTGSSC